MKCDICGKEVGLFDKKKASNGTLCFNCYKEFPEILQPKISHLTINEIAEIVDYENQLKRIDFIESASYKKIHIDDMHGLFAIQDKCITDGNPLNVFSVLDLKDISLHCKNPKANNSGVTCTIELTCEFQNENMSFKTTIANSAKCDVERISRSQVEWREPDELNMFRNIFNQMLKNTVEKYQRETNWSYRFKSDYDYFEAKSIFLLDDDYTEEDVKRRRKLLMKSFHPDNGDIDPSCAIKINNAYKVLLKKIDKFDPSEILR